jgi:hypothetical protein
MTLSSGRDGSSLSRLAKNFLLHFAYQLVRASDEDSDDKMQNR